MNNLKIKFLVFSLFSLNNNSIDWNNKVNEKMKEIIKKHGEFKCLHMI